MNLSKDQEKEIDKQLLIAASTYAKEMQDAINNAVATKNQNVLLIEINSEDQEMQMFFHHNKASYIRQGVLDIASSIIGASSLTDYKGYHEDLITFGNYVTDNLTDDWVFAYGDNDDVLGIKLTEKVLV